MSEKEIPFHPATPLNPRKRALLVGASSGIGAALARILAREGYTIALLARRTNLLDSIRDEINSKSGHIRAFSYTHDVTDFENVPSLLQKIVADLGGLDLFIYCSGASHPPGLENFDFQKDMQTFDVNIMGALAWLNPVAAMFQSLKSGHIVGISSVAGDRGRVVNPALNASKAAMSCYLEALRNRLTRHGVHVLTVKPGFVDTDLLKGAKQVLWVATAEKVAEDIWRAIRSRKQEIYSPARWKWVMLVVRNIPSVIFRRLSF